MKKKIEITHADTFMRLAGNLDENIDYIEKQLDISISVKENHLIIEGLKAELAQTLIINLLDLLALDNEIDFQKIDYAIEMISKDSDSDILQLYKQVICLTPKGQAVTPKTLGQKKYVDIIVKKDLIFGLGPAGTGKTYLAVAMAIKSLKNKEVKKIIITRPAIEAGENLGYLPGGLEMKVDPYLRPIYDAMEDLLGREVYTTYRERGLIEIAPLAYMRGRTLDHAFIILDEAQNTTQAQMKMFLTRFGYGSKVVINGDVTQGDLSKTESSGLKHALFVLKDLEEIGVMEFNENDVVRHGLVKKIIQRYEQSED